MFRRVIMLALAAAVVASASADLAACGDKFLRAGRSSRYRRYAAAHPASILVVYSPARSTPSGVRKFTQWLKRAGHRPVVVKSDSDLAGTFATGKYDVVIVDYVDAARLAGRIDDALGSGPPKPSLLPLLYKPAKSVEAEATRDYPYLLRPDRMDKYMALEEIDRLMGVRVQGVAKAEMTP